MVRNSPKSIVSKLLINLEQCLRCVFIQFILDCRAVGIAIIITDVLMQNDYYKKGRTLAVCHYHVTYEFLSDSTLYSYLNVKELLVPHKCDISSLSNNNRIRSHNPLVRNRAHIQPLRTLNQVKVTDNMRPLSKLNPK